MFSGRLGHRTWRMADLRRPRSELKRWRAPLDRLAPRCRIDMQKQHRRNQANALAPQCGMAVEPERAFLSEVLVECPRCAARAIVVRADSEPRLVCPSCGHSRDSEAAKAVATWWGVRRDGRDSVFGLPLWLATECCGGELLWALNEPHLDYLERFIGSTERDRDFPSPPGNRSLSYKLPKWMQLAKNRQELSAAIQRLRVRLA